MENINLKFLKEASYISALVSITMILIILTGTSFLDEKINPVVGDSFPALHGPFLGIHAGEAELHYNMSYEPLNGKVAPSMYRILTPLLVNLLPFDHLFGFMIINLSAIFLSGIIFYFLLRKLNFSERISAIGVLLFLLSPGIIFSIDDICLTDPVLFLFMILAFYSILIRNSALYFMSLSIGMLNKETILITLPLYIISTIDISKLVESLKSSIIITTLAMLEFIGIRMYLGSHGFFRYMTSIIPSVISLLVHYSTGINIFYIPYSIYWPFSTLWVMSFMKIKHIGNDFIKNSFILLPFIFLQMIIGSDIFRMVFIAFPIIIPASLYIIKDEKKILNIGILICLTFLFFALSFFVGVKYFTTSFLIIYNFQSIFIIVLLLYMIINKRMCLASP